jgi:V/A-type H+-transporting ATPase subunit D
VHTFSHSVFPQAIFSTFIIYKQLGARIFYKFLESGANMETTVSKRNLLAEKKSLALSQKGHDLLEIKLKVLMREKASLEKCIAELSEKLQPLYVVAKQTRAIAEMFCSAERVGELLANAETLTPAVILDATGIPFDEALIAHRRVCEEETKLAILGENLIFINIRISRTKKRASALRNVVIPSHTKRVKFISERLEEHERDELIRVKTVSTSLQA